MSIKEESELSNTGMLANQMYLGGYYNGSITGLTSRIHCSTHTPYSGDILNFSLFPIAHIDTFF